MNVASIHLLVTRMESRESSVAAFVLSLLAGILILVGGFLGAGWFMVWQYGYNGYDGMMGDGMMGASGFGGMMSNLMNGFQNIMHGFGFPLGYMAGLSFIGLIAGAIVIVGALMLRAHPTEHVTWGSIVLAFSVISFFGMGGFYIGALLGIAGGALALSLRPQSKA